MTPHTVRLTWGRYPSVTHVFTAPGIDALDVAQRILSLHPGLDLIIDVEPQK